MPALPGAVCTLRRALYATNTDSGKHLAQS